MSELYSVRMRAAQGGPHEKGGHHISGAERIVKLEEVGTIAQSLADRALHHSKGTADFINITVDLIPLEKITYIDCLKVEEHKLVAFLNHINWGLNFYKVLLLVR